VPRTLDNTRVYDSNSYLTADPAALRAAAERAAEASRRINGGPEEGDSGEEDEEDEDEDEDEDEKMPEAGPSRPKSAPTSAGEDQDQEAGADGVEDEDEEESLAAPVYIAPPRILVTTSPSPCKETYAFCDDLKNVFPGGEFFKRPKGKGFELGRVARWAAKRGYGAMIVVNEDHKTPSTFTPL
jgi:ribosome production factor 1